MKNHNFLFFSIILLVFGCSTPPKEAMPSEKEGYIFAPFDTAEAIADLNIIESKIRQDLMAMLPEKGLAPQLDTLDLMFLAPACECQDWVDPVEYKRVQNFNDKDTSENGKNHIRFDLDKYGYYIDPAVSELKIKWNALVGGNVVRFIGREQEELGYPPDGSITPNPPKGKIFVYYSFEIIKPYAVWGPHIFYEVDKWSGDTLTAPTTLTVY